MMPVWRNVAAGFVFALPGVALILFSIPQLQDGFAVDAAIPVPIYMTRQIPLPTVFYARAAADLRRANAANGLAGIAAAEAAMKAGASPAGQIDRLERSLQDAPSSARGWLLLSEARSPGDATKAATALSQSLLLAPYDYWLAGRLTIDAAVQWDRLDADTRAMALRQVVMLWEEPLLRRNLSPLLGAPGGRALVAEAFEDKPDELRQLNRWISAERRRNARP